MPEEHPPDLGRCPETESSLPEFAALPLGGAAVSACHSIVN